MKREGRGGICCSMYSVLQGGEIRTKQYYYIFKLMNSVNSKTVKVLILLCFMQILAVSIKAQFSGPGSGTQDSPFLISTADQLNEIRNDLSAYYRLVEDIDLQKWINSNMGTNGWIPIGTEGMPFSGVLDGGGHSILNLKIVRTVNVGFFGVASNAAIHNIKLLNAEIYGDDNVGILIGLMHHCNVENVEVAGECAGSSNVGGMIGYINHSMKSEDKSCDYRISRCISSANVVGTGNVGGMVGCVSENTYCYIPQYGGTKTESGRYSDYYTMTTQIIQWLSKSVFKGNIDGIENVGGLIGKVNLVADAYSDNGHGGDYKYYHTSIANSSVCIDSCFVNSRSVVSGKSNVGGIVGASTGNSSEETGGYYNYNSANANVNLLIRYSSNATSILATGDNVGGIIGLSENPVVRINASCSMGNISAVNNVGGISGKGVNNEIENSYSNGNIQGKHSTGGIIGKANNSSICKCYNSGNVDNDGDYAGGIVGQGVQCSVNSCVVASDEICGVKYVNRVAGQSEGIYESNYANVLCDVYSNGYLMSVSDDDYNGYAIGFSSLKSASFYEGLQWDFDNLWVIDNATPYLQYQTKPVNLSNVVTTNGFFLNGTCLEDGVLYVRDASEEVMAANVVNGNWSFYMKPTTHICLYAQAGSKQPSMLTCTNIEIKPLSISLEEREVSLSVGEIYKLNYSFSPSDASSEVVWYSSNAEVAVVNTNGEVTALSNGDTMITVKTSDGALSDECIVHVVVPVEDVTIDAHELQLEKGASFLLSATIVPSDASNKNVIWSSMNSDVVSIDDNGFITANDYGETSVVVQTEDGNKMDYCKVQVIKHVSSVSLNVSELNINVGDCYTLLPAIEPIDATNQNVTWSSSDPAVVSVEDGVVIGLTKGVSIIMVTTEDLSKTDVCVVTVSDYTDISNQDVVTFLWHYDNVTEKLYLYNCKNGDTVKMYSVSGMLIKESTCVLGTNEFCLRDAEVGLVIIVINDSMVCKIAK